MIQNMVGATDTIFCAAVTVASVLMKTVCVPQTMLSIPETMVSAVGNPAAIV
jgi:hypothetical protein